MVRSKAPSKKQKRGVDFNKIKRKIGRKLPPPKNATDTTVKSKAIILPEQSVASDRLGLATSRKGLTLKELLQQSSHHNPKIRRDALNGIKDLVLKHPSELRLHRLAIIEKLRERISDDDKLVRETLYQLLQSVIFPSFKEEIPGPVISLIMAYVFNAMTHLTVDIRLMAFKFFDLIVQHYPSSFFLYAEKVLQNYEDILRNNQIYFRDKSNLKVALVGLARCLSLLAYDKRNIEHSHEQATVLHAFEPELHKEHSGDTLILKKLEDLMPTLVNCFHEFLPSARTMPVVETHLFDCMLHTLESISLAVRVYVAGAYKPTTFGVSFPSLTGRNEGVMKLGSMPLLLKRLFDIFPINPIHYSTGKEDYRYFALNVTLTEIFLHLHDWAGAPVALMEKFLGFITNILSEQIFSSRRPNKVSLEKNLASLLAFIPKVVLKVDNNWKSRLLEGFTIAFQGCKPESKLTLACLSAMEEMLFSTQRRDPCLLEARSAEFLEFQVTWVKALTELLLRLGDKYPSTSKVILHIQHRLGKSAPMGSPIAKEYDSMQYPLKEFYSTYSDDVKGSTNYGPFIKLPRDCQELAICCLYYFSSLDQRLLESLACCSLCHDLDPYVLSRIVEILNSAYKAGRVQITDHINFLVTLLAKFKVIPEQFLFGGESVPNISNRGNFKALTDAVCCSISQIGDGSLVLKILQKTIFNQMSLKLPLDNMRALLRVVVILSPIQAGLPEETLSTLSYFLFEYCVDAASYLSENYDESANTDRIRIFQYYTQPAIFLFHRNTKLLGFVLDLLGSSITEPCSSLASGGGARSVSEQLSRIHTVTAIIRFIYKDVNLQQSLSSCRAAMKEMLQNIHIFQASNHSNMPLEERHKLQCTYDQLKTQTGKLHCWDASDFQQFLMIDRLSM